MLVAHTPLMKSKNTFQIMDLQTYVSGPHSPHLTYVSGPHSPHEIQKLRTALFCVIKQLVVAILYRLFPP